MLYRGMALPLCQKSVQVGLMYGLFETFYKVSYKYCPPLDTPSFYLFYPHLKQLLNGFFSVRYIFTSNVARASQLG